MSFRPARPVLTDWSCDFSSKFRQAFQLGASDRWPFLQHFQDARAGLCQGVQGSLPWNSLESWSPQILERCGKAALGAGPGSVLQQSSGKWSLQHHLCWTAPERSLPSSSSSGRGPRGMQSTHRQSAGKHTPRLVVRISSSTSEKSICPCLRSISSKMAANCLDMSSCRVSSLVKAKASPRISSKGAFSYS